QIVLLDSDIAINAATAPKITEQVAPEHVGGVISGSHIPEDLRLVLLSRQQGKAFDYQRGSSQWGEYQLSGYRFHGIEPPGVPQVVQTGVLVASPERHAELFRTVYAKDNPTPSRCHEQFHLSHALLTAGVFRPIDTRFNSVFGESVAVYYP